MLAKRALSSILYGFNNRFDLSDVEIEFQVHQFETGSLSPLAGMYYVNNCGYIPAHRIISDSLINILYASTYVRSGPKSNDPNQMIQFRYKYTYYITYSPGHANLEKRRRKNEFLVGQ